MKCTGVSFSRIALKGCCSVLGLKYILLHFNLCRCSSSFISGDNIFTSAGLCIAPVGFCAALCGGLHAKGAIIRAVPSAAAVGLVVGSSAAPPARKKQNFPKNVHRATTHQNSFFAVPREALFATDTSGGFFDALENFRRVNFGMELFFEAEKVIAPEILHCGDLDPMLFLIGGVGEYELVYAMPRGQSAPGIKIGEGTFGPGKDNSFRWSLNGQNGIMKNPPPDYRNLPPEQWFSATADYLREMMI